MKQEVYTENSRPLPIKPPRSNKKKLNTTNNNKQCYSLFDTMSPPLNWLDKKPIRKHSVSVDGSDCLKYENNYAPFWRRASLPNKLGFIKPCAVCNLQIYSASNICEHSICQHCMIISSCPLCPKEPLSSPSSSTTTLIFNPSYSFNSSIDFIYPHQDEKFYIGDLLSPSTSFDSFLTRDLYCVKLSNIPWDVSQKDIKLFFKDFELPSESMHAQSIHIMMDRITGKTLSDCYIEFMSESDALRALQFGNQKILKNRPVSVSISSQEEFSRIVFPSRESTINQLDPSKEKKFITSEEINSLLTICKNYKLHFSRKCAERPFENIITIITKYPWHKHELVTKEQRDSIFNLLKSSIDALKTHLSKQVVHIDNSLLKRMLRCGIICPAFTEQQKNILLEMGGYKTDLELFMSNTKQVTNIQETTHMDTSYIYINSNTAPLTSGTLSLLDILNTPVSKESDEDSYYFCEKEEVEDDEDSFYKL